MASKKVRADKPAKGGSVKGGKLFENPEKKEKDPIVHSSEKKPSSYKEYVGDAHEGGVRPGDKNEPIREEMRAKSRERPAVP